jgi:hypothetical protein
MLNTLSKLLFMIILLVAFVGQTMAYSLMTSYDSISELKTRTQSQAVNTGHDEYMSAENTSEDDCCDVECCESECICPANACGSMVYLHSNLLLSDSVVISESLNLLSTQAALVIKRSLYRPPIFTS